MARILLIDDEVDILKVLSMILQSRGHETVMVSDGNEAYQKIGSEEFDLMICDLRMSPVNGMELLKLAHDVRPAMPVIMLTAYGQVDTAIEALQLGAFDYVKKPFRADELLAIVNKALESKKLAEDSNP
jgi:DNA-binding NtrC family response regulator